MKPSSRSRRTPFCLSDSCTFLLVACLLLSGVSSASPCITLSKKSGPPTSKILVSGRGFEPRAKVDIYFGTKDERLVVTNGQGEFKDAEAYAPRCARPGKHWVMALERNNRERAQKPFLVRTDWRQFHFVADGKRVNPYENVLNRQNVKQMVVKWSVSAGGLVQYSSPAVVNGKVYIGSDDHNVYALDSRTGHVVWRYLTGDTVQSSPAVVNGVVYVSSHDQKLYALDACTGAKLWSFTALSPFGVSSPTVANGVVYVGALWRDDSVYALNARTGEKLWSFTTGGDVAASAAVVNGVVYIGSLDGNLYALDALTGVLRWSYTGGGWIYGSPTVADGVLYFGAGDGKVYALNADTGAELWTYVTGAQVETTPAVANGVVYVGSSDHNLYALKASTGALLWKYWPASGGPSSPTVANGVVYSGSFEGDLYAFDARTGNLLGVYAIPETVYSSPTVVDGVVYVGSTFSAEGPILYAFTAKQGLQGAMVSPIVP